MKETEVAIIGAGLAGLAAALELQKQNISFIVLEARNRPGGRVHSIQADGNVTVDLGAQWVSPYHNRMKQLIEKFGLHLVSTYREGKILYNLNGVIQERKGPWPKMSLYELIDVLRVKKQLNKQAKQFKAEEPWHSKIARELDKKTLEQFIEEYANTDMAKSFYRLLIEEALCSKLYEVSTLDLLWCISAAGSVERLLTAEDLWIKEGLEILVKKIVDSLGEQVRFESPVNSIHYEKDEACIITEKGHWNVKRVILAVPPNLLTRIQFSPPLPANRAQLNERSGLPAVIKMIFVYETPFWRAAGLSGTAYSNQGPIKLTIDSSPTDTSKGVLTSLITGEFARQVGEVSSDKQKEIAVNSLIQFFGKEAKKPNLMIVKNWSADEWTRGGYGTHFSTGMISQFGEMLFKPIGPLHWAGTETASEWRMYMEGALQSGERAAKEVSRILKEQ
jgi:monoamine oxidase